MNNFTPKKIKCKECGKDTIIGSGAGKYCEDCKKIVIKRQNKVNEANAKYIIRKARKLTCQECGCDITNFKYTKKYCPDCKKIVYARQLKKYDKKRYQDNKETIKAYCREYYKIPKNKERHRMKARESARRMRLLKKMAKNI